MPAGKIVKALSGFYYVKTKDDIFQCRGRGVFRKNKVTPLVGDEVEFEESNPGEGYVIDVKPRKNELIRPPVANIDQAIIVVSAAQPDFSSLLLDRFLVLVESKSIEPIIIISKMDMVSSGEKEVIENYKRNYQGVGYTVVTTSTKQENGLTHVEEYLAEKISVIAGQSGVGKTSLLNAINPDLELETNEISTSLGRGKHTTRHVELIEIGNGLVADTPGFSSLDFNDIEADQLPDCFPEMLDIKDQCKFRGCKHHKEPKCAVKLAVENNKITAYRYDHYLQFLEEIQNRKPRY